MKRREEGRKGKERSKANLNIWPRGVDLTKDVGEMWRRELHHPSHSKTAQILSWDLSALSPCSLGKWTMSFLFFTPPRSAGLFCWQLGYAGNYISQTAFLWMVLGSRCLKVKPCGPREGHPWWEAGRGRQRVAGSSWFVLIPLSTVPISPWSCCPIVMSSPPLDTYPWIQTGSSHKLP